MDVATTYIYYGACRDEHLSPRIALKVDQVVGCKADEIHTTQRSLCTSSSSLLVVVSLDHEQRVGYYFENKSARLPLAQVGCGDQLEEHFAIACHEWREII